MMKKIYIITGANGFLGNNIVRQLVQTPGHEVRALVLPGESANALHGLDCKIYRGDVTKKESLHSIFEVPEHTALYVIHWAAIVYIKSKYDPNVYNVNVNGTKTIIEKVLEKNAKLVYVSSVHAITEKPHHETITETTIFEPEKVKGQYAKTKAEIANYLLKTVRENNLNACIVHPSGMIGPNDFGNSHLTQLIIDFASGKLKACVKGGYDFVDVRDVTAGVISACERGRAGECYILSNRYVEIRELLTLIRQLTDIKTHTYTLPLWLAKLTAPLSEIYYTILKQPPLYTKYSLYTLSSNSHFSNQKAKRELNYHNRNIAQTLRDTITWLKEHNRI